jgi:hypothetical protein
MRAAQEMQIQRGQANQQASLAQQKGIIEAQRHAQALAQKEQAHQQALAQQRAQHRAKMDMQKKAVTAVQQPPKENPKE